MLKRQKSKFEKNDIFRMRFINKIGPFYNDTAEVQKKLSFLNDIYLYQLIKKTPLRLRYESKLLGLNSDGRHSNFRCGFYGQLANSADVFQKYGKQTNFGKNFRFRIGRVIITR